MYAVDPGDTATVGIKLTTNSDKPLDHDVTVNYSLGTGTATAGTDYTDASGSVTFATGAASGSVQTFTVQTLPNSTPSEAKTIPIQLTATGADVTLDKPVVVINAHGLPYLNPNLPVAQRVADLMSRMTLADKIGQMTQAERGDLTHQSDITTNALGSLLSGGGSTPTPNTPEAWADMIDSFQARAQATHLQIPLIYGEDSVHGDNNLVGATVFPHNIGMGATRDPALVKQEGEIAATETRATGATWAFSPCVCVTRDERWGRSYESYGEDPALVDQMETIIDGLQGDGALSKNTSVLATAKHFVGDGGTTYGSSTAGSYTIDQGVTTVTQAQLDALFLEPFKQAVQKHGVGSVMPSYSSLQIVGKDTAPIKMHARGDMITGVLKQQYGFNGFVISDWQGINQIGPDYETDVKTGVNAGIDMVMVPDQYVNFEHDLTDLVANGGVTQARIDDAVSRILTQKFKLGLFEHPYTDRTNASTIGDAAHRAVARQAAAESQVLLKNAGAAAALAVREHLRRRQQRERPRQPDRRLDGDVAGRVGQPRRRHDDLPGHAGRRAERALHVLRGRVRADDGLERRRGRRRRDAVRGRRRRHRQRPHRRPLGGRQGRGRQGLRGDEVRRARRLRPADEHRVDPGRGERDRRLVAAGHRGRGRRRHAVRAKPFTGRLPESVGQAASTRRPRR